MEFLSLFKKYVMTNHDECRKLYENRFNSENSFHLDIKIKENDAFFFGHPAIYSKVSEIYKNDCLVKESFDGLPNVAQNHYIKRCLIEEIQQTNEIEGVVSTRKEIDEIIKTLEKVNKNNNHRLYGIVNSYKKLFNERTLKLATSQDIRNIYDDLLLKEIELENKNNVPDGVIFRKGGVEVDNTQGEAIHKGIFPESEIISCIDKSLGVLKENNLDLLIRISIFHYLFGYIHPFYDGNGRTDRFITSYLLSKVLTPITAFSISATIRERISDYYKAFKETNDSRNFGDIGTFVNTMLDIIAKAQEKIIEYTKEKKEILDSKMKKIVDIGKHSKKEIDFLYVLLQASLFSSDGISIKEINSITRLDYKTIDSYIRKNADIIEVNNKKKEYLYSLNTNI